LRNAPEFLTFWFGVNKLGATLVPINVSLKSDGLAYIINDSDASLILLEEETRENYETARDQLDGISEEFLLNSEGDEGYEPFDALASGRSSGNPQTEIAEDDCACVIYTSGTTGLPKGVMLPHFSFINTGWEFVDHVNLTEADRPFTTLPLFHCNAQQLTTMGTMLAKTDFAMTRWFSASKFWEQIDRYDGTLFHYIGTMIQVLYNQDDLAPPEDHDIRMGIGAAAPKDIIPKFEDRFGIQLLEGYGQTELATAATSVRPGESHKSAQGKIGEVWDHLELRIADEDDNQVPQGEEGEVVARPTRPNTIMLGYYGKPEKTVDTWQNLWLHTGDLGKVDEDGDLQFVDRMAFFIRRRGENISSYEVENVLTNHDAVEESAAIGVPSELGEDEIKAIINTKPGQDVEPLELIKYAEERLAYFKVPRYIEFTDSFPKTETERIQKTKLKERGIGDAWDREESEYELER